MWAVNKLGAISNIMTMSKLFGKDYEVLEKFCSRGPYQIEVQHFRDEPPNLFRLIRIDHATYTKEVVGSFDKPEELVAVVKLMSDMNLIGE